MPETLRSPRNKPVIWTVSMTRLEELFRDVTPEYDQQAVIHNLHGGYEEAVNLLNKRLARQPCDVIIAAGSNGSYIRKHIDKPVVLVEPSGFDLMQALSRARRRSQGRNKRIAVVTHQTDLPTFTEFCEDFGLEIEQRSFLTAEDARNCVAELQDRDVHAVVGTGLITGMAESAGMAGILLYSPDSVRRALNAALDLVTALEQRAPVDEVRRPGRQKVGGARYTLDHMLGQSEVMQTLRRRIQRAAGAESTVLIHGATGTGKELAAQAVHAASARRRQAFVAINCGAIAESLLESELFGHEEGAFTGARRGGRPGLIEAAHKGSLFLDEIGEMPLALQTRLLRVLEEREVLRVGSNHTIPVDIRVIAATHCDLPAMVAQGRFRADLYYRLNVLRINLPALSERRADIPALFAAFADRFRQGISLKITREANALLAAYPWPGNLRELKNIVERVLADTTGREVQVDLALLRQSAPELFNEGEAGSHPQAATGLPAADHERRQLEQVLRECMGNRGEATRRLGISRSTLWRRMQQYGLLKS